jgi:DNA repair exonuclease SbcCD ATPase subunit
VSRTTIDHSGIYEQEEQMQMQELTMTGRAVQELSTFNSLIETVIPYGDLTVADDGIGKVEEAHKAVKRLSASIEKKRKELKADALEYGRTVDSIAKQLTEKVDGVESKLKAEREAFDAVEKAEKAAKEAAKMAAKQARINEMVANGIALDWVAAEMPEQEWMWWFSKAKKEAAAIVEEKRIAEEFEAKQRKEREELAAKMRAEQEAETKRQAEELRIRAAEIEKQRLADEAVMAEQRKAMESEKAELFRQQQELRKAAEAKDKAEREVEKLARLEALKPEIEKAQGFAECMITDAQDSLIRLGNPEWAGDAMHAIRNCGAAIISLVQCR